LADEKNREGIHRGENSKASNSKKNARWNSGKHRSGSRILRRKNGITRAVKKGAGIQTLIVNGQKKRERGRERGLPSGKKSNEQSMTITKKKEGKKIGETTKLRYPSTRKLKGVRRNNLKKKTQAVVEKEDHATYEELRRRINGCVKKASAEAGMLRVMLNFGACQKVA